MDTTKLFRLSAVLLVALGGIGASADKGNSKKKEDPLAEDSTLIPEENLQWPEAHFADASIRGRAFKPGEKFTFHAQWGIFRKAGQIVIETDRKNETAGEKFVIRMETASKGLIRSFYPMTLKAETVLDTDHWRMDTNVVNGKTRSTLSETKTTFDYENGTMDHFDAHNPHRCGTKPLPYPYPLDYASSLLQIRSWDLQEGEVYPLLISSRGKFYFIEMKIFGTENINTRFGKMEAYRIEPVTAYPQSKIFREGGNFAIWISTDSRRIPLRFDLKTSIGTASMRLNHYELTGEALVAKN